MPIYLNTAGHVIESPTGGVVAPGETFDADESPQLAASVAAGRLLPLKSKSPTKKGTDA